MQPLCCLCLLKRLCCLDLRAPEGNYLFQNTRALVGAVVGVASPFCAFSSFDRLSASELTRALEPLTLIYSGLGFRTQGLGSGAEARSSHSGSIDPKSPDRLLQLFERRYGRRS